MVVGTIGLQQRLQFAQGFHDHVGGGGTFLDGFSRFPIQALNLIGKHHACSVRIVTDDNFEGVALSLAGHGTTEYQAAGSVIVNRREDKGRSMACLFMAGLRVEVQPHDISSIRNVGRFFHHQIS